MGVEMKSQTMTQKVVKTLSTNMDEEGREEESEAHSQEL